ncbi:MAG: hypothetical protein JO189_33420 [Deltaproteobacteria bacterium]|nr:hypothetical protein [Deltaproteobacteria bacterium]
MNGLSITVELKAEDDYKAIKAALTRVNVLPWMPAGWARTHSATPGSRLPSSS